MMPGIFGKKPSSENRTNKVEEGKAISFSQLEKGMHVRVVPTKKHQRQTGQKEMSGSVESVRKDGPKTSNYVDVLGSSRIWEKDIDEIIFLRNETTEEKEAREKREESMRTYYEMIGRAQGST